jgi:hypothetical protein
LPNGRSPRGRSFDRDPFGGPPPNLPIRLYEWSTLDPRIFMPPWYPLIIIGFKPTNKFPYQKLQNIRYVKNIDHDAHNRVFKKASKANGKTMELVDIINLLGFTLLNNILEWGENFVQDYPNSTFEELEQTFCKCFVNVKNDEEIYM